MAGQLDQVGRKVSSEIEDKMGEAKKDLENNRKDITDKGSIRRKRPK